MRSLPSVTACVVIRMFCACSLHLLALVLHALYVFFALGSERLRKGTNAHAGHSVRLLCMFFCAALACSMRARLLCRPFARLLACSGDADNSRTQQHHAKSGRKERGQQHQIHNQHADFKDVQCWVFGTFTIKGGSQRLFCLKSLAQVGTGTAKCTLASIAPTSRSHRSA